MPGLPLGVRPVRGTVGTSGLALPQFLVVAEHLDGQQGDGFQPPKQILDPSGILADDMVDDGPCSGFRRRRDSRVKRFDEGQAGPFEVLLRRLINRGRPAVGPGGGGPASVAAAAAPDNR